MIFFSSRRRHTRWPRDWSSDVCSSDLRYQSHNVNDTENYISLLKLADQLDEKYDIEGNRIFYLSVSPSLFGTVSSRSEERRVGKEHSVKMGLMSFITKQTSDAIKEIR